MNKKDEMTVQEAIIKINSSPIYSITIADAVIKGQLVKSHQDLDQRRWCSVATRVYHVNGGYVGVRGPFQIFTETMSWKDLEIPCEAFEVIPEPDIYYVKKNN